MLARAHRTALSRAAATLVAIALTGAPNLVRAIAPAQPHAHPCQCPRGEGERCSCPRCHGPEGARPPRPAPATDGVRRPACHESAAGGATLASPAPAGEPEPAAAEHRTGGPATRACLTSWCGDPEAALASRTGVEPFLLPAPTAPPAAPRRAETFADDESSASPLREPETPPPRAARQHAVPRSS